MDTPAIPEMMVVVVVVTLVVVVVNKNPQFLLKFLF